jgi:transposase-like protein
MVKIPRKVYKLDFKQEAVRLVEWGQRVSEAARSVGILEQTVANWVKAHRANKLRGSGRSGELTDRRTGDCWQQRRPAEGGLVFHSRSRHSVRQSRLRAASRRARQYSFDEPQGQLLG